MIRKSILYFILIGNFILLTIGLYLWTDPVEQIFNEYVRGLHFTLIVLLSIFIRITLYFLSRYFKSRGINSQRLHKKYAIILTLSISSLLYGYYDYKIFVNRIYNYQIRSSILNKVDGNLDAESPFLVSRTNTFITLEEYRLIQTMNWFPDLPNSAKNIEFVYTSSGIDYLFRVSYDVAIDFKVEEYNLDSRQETKNQSVLVNGENKRVTRQIGRL